MHMNPNISESFIAPYSIFCMAVCLIDTKEKTIYMPSWKLNSFPFPLYPDVSNTNER
jgi:hypothetical protein